VNRLILLLVILCIVVPVIAAPKPSTSRAIAAYANVPPIFEANQGQARKEVKFLARGNSYVLFLTSDGMQLALTRPVNDDPRAERSSAQAQQRQHIASTVLLRMKLVGASAAANFEALEPLPGTVNYFVGIAGGEFKPLSLKAQSPERKTTGASKVLKLFSS
jgi:hypothetical protein